MDPHALFEEWLAEAQLAEPNDPTAMALATVDAEGRPSARMVLSKAHDEERLRLKHQSRQPKGARLAANPRVALLFHWKSLRRQLRVEGRSSRGSAIRRRIIISPPAPAIPSSAPGPPTSRGRSNRGRCVRGALRGDEGEVRRAVTCRARRAGGLAGRSRADRVLDPATTGPRPPTVRPRTASAGAKDPL